MFQQTSKTSACVRGTGQSLNSTATNESTLVFKDLKTTQDFGAFGSWIRYRQSKFANILYASELARRYGDRLTAVSVRPSVINTNLVNSLGWANRTFVAVGSVGMKITVREGAYSVQHAVGGYVGEGRGAEWKLLRTCWSFLGEKARQGREGSGRAGLS